MSGLLAAAGRVLLSIIFVVGGIGKLMAPGATMGYIAAGGLPVPFLALIVAIVIELGGGLALLVGYQTRLVAFGLAVWTMITALIFHHDLGDHAQLIQFQKNLAITGGMLYVAAAGAMGPCVDYWRGRKAK